MSIIHSAGVVPTASPTFSGGSLTADFYSDWSGSTWTDNSKWSFLGGDSGRIGDYLQVETTGGPGGGRFLRHEDTPGDADGNLFFNLAQIASPISAISVGEVLTVRFYHRIPSGGGDTDGLYHPAGYNNNVGSPPTGNWPIYNWLESGGSWMWYIQFTSTNYQPSTFPISEAEWHRYEIYCSRDATSTWTWDCRVYDSNPTLLYQGSDMLVNAGAGPDSLVDDSFTATSGGERLWTGFGNGIGGTISANHIQDDWSDFVMIVDSSAHTNIPYGSFDHET